MKRVTNNWFYLGLLLLFFFVSIYAQSTPEDIDHYIGISGELDAPLRLASDALGNIYLTDAVGRSISKYDPSGDLLENISLVEFPVSLAVNSEGQLFIGDGATGHIFKYDESLGAEEFYTGTEYPSSMEFSPDNILYVADSKLQEVIALDLSGNVVQTIGSGILDFPTGIAFDGNNKRILVGEHGGKGTGFSPTVKVWMFDLQGDLINSFGSHGNGDGQFYRIQGLTIGKCGNIYVVDPYQARISIFDDNGVFITKFGDYGLQTGELNIPMDIVFTGQERLWVSSMNNSALEVFAVTDTLPCSNIQSGNALICDGEATDIEIAFTGTAPWTFTYTVDGLAPATITTSENPYLLTVSEAGHYEVTALSDANFAGACFTGSADVTVANIAPTSHMAGDTTICTDETTELSIDFTGSPPWSFTYTQDGINPRTVTTTNNPHILTVSEAGLYEVTSLTGGGCTGTSFTGSAAISVNPLPTATIVEGNGQIMIDPGETTELTVALTGEPPWDIIYTVDDLNPVSINNINENSYLLAASKAGTYEIKEVSDTWCTNAVSLGYPELVLKSAQALPTSQIIGGDLFICPGESVPFSILFSGAPPWTFTYIVDTLMTTTIFNTFTNPYIVNAIYPGIYEVTALSDSYYSGTDFSGNAVVSINPLPVPDFDYTSDDLDVSFSNNSMDADSYYWEFGDGNTSVEMSPLHQFNSAGDYSVSLTASNGWCVDSTITRMIQVTAVSVEPLEFDDLLRVYPNPSNGMVTIETGDAGNLKMTIEIIDVNGRIIYSNVFHSGNVTETVDLSSFSSGLYFVRMVSNEFINCRKLILNTNKRQ
ncbi:MAG: T9SS type A sorting domain-containing protein [Bacteroidota bacterium]